MSPPGPSARAQLATTSHRDRWLVGGCLVTVSFLLWNIAQYRYGRDQGIYAVVAETMVQGGAPYRDAWDFKPPGIFAIYYVTRLLLGRGEQAIRVVECLGLASMAWAYAILSRRWVGAWQAGVVGAAVAIGVHAQLEFWHTAQPESFGAMLIAWALVAATYAPAEGASRAREKQLAAWAAAGFLYTCAALLKPPLGGGFVVSLAFAARAAWRAGEGGPSDRARAALRPALGFAIGAVASLAPTALYFVAKGAWGDLYQTLFVFTPYYTKLSFERRYFLAYVYFTLQHWLVELSSFVSIGLLTCLAGLPLGGREREATLHVGLVVATQLVGVALQAKFFPYHYGASLALGGLLAGWGGYKAWRALSSMRGGVVVYVALVYLVSEGRGATRDIDDTYWQRCKKRLALVVDPGARPAVDDALYSVADVNSGANREVAAWLRAHTRPDDRVFVWGFEPEIYDLSGRRAASRYIYDVPQRTTWALASRDTLMADLAATPPAVIVVERRDVFPSVTGNELDSRDSLPAFPRLQALLQERYRLETTIEDFDLYVVR